MRAFTNSPNKYTSAEVGKAEKAESLQSNEARRLITIANSSLKTSKQSPNFPRNKMKKCDAVNTVAGHISKDHEAISSPTSSVPVKKEPQDLKTQDLKAKVQSVGQNLARLRELRMHTPAVQKVTSIETKPTVKVEPTTMEPKKMPMMKQIPVELGTWMKFEYKDLQHLGNEKYVDAHAHLDYMRYNNGRESPLFNTWDEMTQLYSFFPPQLSGIVWNIVHPGHLMADSKWVEEMIKDDRVLGVSVGCHPRHVDKMYSPNKHGQSHFEWLDWILENKKKYKICAIGECGLETVHNPPSTELQMSIFHVQLSLAKKHLLPLVIHCRSGTQGEQMILNTIIAILGNMHSVHFHCAPLNAETLTNWMDKLPNCYFGFTPRVLDNKPAFVEALKTVPLTRMLLESDAPYFATKLSAAMKAPRLNRGQMVSSPAEASTVAAYIAKVKGVPIDHVLLVTRMNTLRFYNIDRELL